MLPQKVFFFFTLNFCTAVKIFCYLPKKMIQNCKCSVSVKHSHILPYPDTPLVCEWSPALLKCCESHRKHVCLSSLGPLIHYCSTQSCGLTVYCGERGLLISLLLKRLRMETFRKHYFWVRQQEIKACLLGWEAGRGSEEDSWHGSYQG